MKRDLFIVSFAACACMWFFTAALAVRIGDDPSTHVVLGFANLLLAGSAVRR